jgi:hypothetical protein
VQCFVSFQFFGLLLQWIVASIRIILIYANARKFIELLCRFPMYRQLLFTLAIWHAPLWGIDYCSYEVTLRHT